MVKLTIKPTFRQLNNKVEIKQFPTETSLLFGVQEATIFYTQGLLSSKNVILRHCTSSIKPRRELTSQIRLQKVFSAGIPESVLKCPNTDLFFF